MIAFIPACPRCTCPMLPHVAFVWPHQFTTFACHCGMLMALTDGGDPPDEERVLNYSWLLAYGHLSLP